MRGVYGQGRRSEHVLRLQRMRRRAAAHGVGVLRARRARGRRLLCAATPQPPFPPDSRCAGPYAKGNTTDDEKFDPKHNKTSPEGPKLKCNETIAVDKVCVDGTPWKPHYAKASSIVGLKNITDIQQEIMANGPVTCAFKVYEDFFHYKSGVVSGAAPCAASPEASKEGAAQYPRPQRTRTVLREHGQSPRAPKK